MSFIAICDYILKCGTMFSWHPKTHIPLSVSLLDCFTWEHQHIVVLFTITMIMYFEWCFGQASLFNIYVFWVWSPLLAFLCNSSTHSHRKVIIKVSNAQKYGKYNFITFVAQGTTHNMVLIHFALWYAHISCERCAPSIPLNPIHMTSYFTLNHPLYL